MAGAQSRQIPVSRSDTSTDAARVTSAVTGAAAGAAAAGTSVSCANTMGAMLTGISMSTVPATVGVNTRRKAAILEPRMNCTKEATMISVASKAGPPCSMALTLTARKADVLPMTRMYPAPSRPKRTACTIVAMPHTISAANTAQFR